MERQFELTHGELKVFCKESRPDCGEIHRVVLGVHGIGGSTEDDIQAGLSEEMEFFSSATLRFDFPGHGQSSMSDDCFTVKNCKLSLLKVAAYARAQYPDVEDLCIFASGFGAYITLVSLKDLLEMPGRIRLVVQTPSVMMHETLLTMIRRSRPTFEAMEKHTFRIARPLTVTYSFYKELEANVVLKEHSIPMLILHGESDAYIRNEDVRQFRRLNKQSKLVIIPGTSHRFLEEGAWDMVLDLTRDWFEFEQVLVTDWE